MSEKGECCANCAYFHRLKHKFVKCKGFEESYCCDVIMHLPKSDNLVDVCEPWIQEVEPDGMCEMFEEREKNDRKDRC